MWLNYKAISGVSMVGYEGHSSLVPHNINFDFQATPLLRLFNIKSGPLLKIIL